METVYTLCQRIVSIIMPFVHKIVDVFTSTPNDLIGNANLPAVSGVKLWLEGLRLLGVADWTIIELMFVSGVSVWVIVSIVTFFTNILT